MARCSECSNWAQWVLLWVERPQPDEKPETTTFIDETGAQQTKELAPRGLKFKKGPVLCTVHKEAMERIPSEAERVFRFAGSIPARVE